jgi:hypothetical protein
MLSASGDYNNNCLEQRRVGKMKKGVFVLLSFLLFFLAANPGYGAPCNYQIALYDTFGDGWNGALVTVYVEGVPVLSSITLSTGYGPEYHSFPVNSGDEISTSYQPGAWAQEPYYTIINSEGNTVATDGASYTVPIGLSGITAVCPGTQSIPTLSEWGMIILAMLIGSSAILVLRKQKTSFI